MQSVGRRSLAIKLLEEEPSAAQQVPLLISLAKGTSTTSGQSPGADASSGGEGAEDTLSRALRKAVDARDPDLVYLALFAAYRSRPLPEFWKMVGPRPTARNLFVKYTRVKVRYLAFVDLQAGWQLSMNWALGMHDLSMMIITSTTVPHSSGGLLIWHADSVLAMQEPELLETLYVTQQMAPEAAELALETALRTLSNAITSSSTSSSASATRQDSAVTSAISGLQEASHKYGQVCMDGVLTFSD